MKNEIELKNKKEEGLEDDDVKDDFAKDYDIMNEGEPNPFKRLMSVPQHYNFPPNFQA